MLRKTVTAVAGFAFAGGALLGPSTSAFAAPATSAPAMAQVAYTSGKPSVESLTPHGVQGRQSYIELSAEQVANVKAIIAATKKSGMDERAAVVAIATALQESKLENLGHLGELNDHDSLGLFQQRPSVGWGTPRQVTDPAYATAAFLDGLKGVDGWREMPLTDAAQAVQVSAFPFAYAQWESMAAKTVAAYWS